MIINDIRVYRYSLPLRRTLRLKNRSFNTREGLLIRLSDRSGNYGWGEVAPLPGFSRETLDSVINELPRVLRALKVSPVPDDVAALNGACEAWLGPLTSSAALRFGLESATLNLVALSKAVSLADLLAANHPAQIEVNALLSGPETDVLSRVDKLLEDGYSTFKLKIGRRSIEDETMLISAIRNRIGAHRRLRLDANRGYNIGTAFELFRRIEPYEIEYIEEPVENLNQLRVVLKDRRRRIPIALDESLLELQPKDLAAPFGVKAVILKPTLLGLERTVAFARVAAERGITPVVSSSFESSPGLIVLAALASSMTAGDSVAAGLDTLSWFDGDTVDCPLSIRAGHIRLDSLGEIQRHIRLEALEEVSVAFD